jgi:ESS family glutamate:Na+ symporter
MLIEVDAISMLAVSILVLFAGMWLTRLVPVLEDNCIPPPVTGGLLFSLLTWAMYSLGDFELQFDMQIRDLLLMMFFGTVGLSADVRALLGGGRTLLILIALAGLFLILQNSIGIGLALGLGARPGYGLMAGSVSLAGGHGTAAAWGIEAEAAGLAQASEIGLIFATFGLIAGGLVGSPLAQYVIKRDGLQPDAQPAAPQTEARAPARPRRKHPLAGDPLLPFLSTLLVLTVSISLGAAVNAYLNTWGMLLPGFLTAMLVAIVFANALNLWGQPLETSTVNGIREFSLNIFLTMSMMTLQLWIITDSFWKILLVIALQVAAIVIFAVYFVYRLAGRNYDAAVMTAGFVGLGLGATPVALANMDAITRHYGPSLKAFLVIPIIGAFFIDLLNAGVINFFIALLMRLAHTGG